MTIIDQPALSAPLTEDDWLASLPAFSPPRPVEERRTVVLSPMLANVLESLCEGKSNKGIGRDWGISEDTVKTHMRRLLTRLGARDRAHVIALVAFGVVDVRVTPSTGRPRFRVTGTDSDEP